MPNFNFPLLNVTQQRILEKVSQTEQNQTNVFLKTKELLHNLNNPDFPNEKNPIATPVKPIFRIRSRSPSPQSPNLLPDILPKTTLLKEIKGSLTKILQPIKQPEEEIKKERIIPINSPIISAKKLDLNLFDLEEDEKTGDEWEIFVEKLKLENGIVDGFSPFFQSTEKEYQWKPVKVLKFCKEKKKFLIERIETKETKYVSRLALRFANEHPSNFTKRIQKAKALRQTYEENQRFQYYIENIPTEKVEPMSEKVFEIFQTEILFFLVKVSFAHEIRGFKR